jgi:GT2 family glycosyltransferase
MTLGLSDVTVVISAKIDCDARLRNLGRLESFYAYHAEGAEILVVEQGSHPRIEPSSILKTHFIRDDGLHWKTRNMNLGAALSDRPILLMSDCDTIPHPDALAAGQAYVRAKGGFISLYNGIVVNLKAPPQMIRWPEFIATLPIYKRTEVAAGRSFDEPDHLPLYGNADHPAIGGCFLASRQAFLGVGGMNTNFVSYGFEDQEFYLRAQRLGHEFPLVDGHNLFHFDHPRGMESRYGQFYRQNQQELARVAAMSPDDIRSYAVHGFSQIRFKPGCDYARFSTVNADGWHQVPDQRTNLFQLLFLVVADPAIVARDASCLNPLLDHLEKYFHGYDIRICENRTTAYKYQRNRKNVAFAPVRYGPSRDELAQIAAESGRPSVWLLRLRADAKRQFREIRETLENIRQGVPILDVLPTVEAALRDV